MCCFLMTGARTEGSTESGSGEAKNRNCDAWFGLS